MNKISHPRHERGFTLIELLTVIIIIGVLAAIAIPVFSAQKSRAQDSQTVSDVRNIVTAAETLLSDRTKSFDDVSKTNVEFASAKNVSWSIKGSNTLGGYCIVAENLSGKKWKGDSSATILTYDSASGGLDKRGSACPTTGANAVGTAGTDYDPSGSTAVGSAVAYAPTVYNNSGTGYNGTIQSWNVADTGIYEITTVGASGGAAYGGGTNGGLGTTMTAQVKLNAGQTVRILVGQMGATGLYTNYDSDHYWSGTGGGGSFVAVGSTALVVAGGGGGGYACGGYGAGGNATIGNNGDVGGNSNWAGAGFSASGTSYASAFTGGGQGAYARNYAPDGGFGGGSVSDHCVAGGGGGYSGGAGGNGGGSYIISSYNGVPSTTVATSVNTTTGHGKVTIKRIS